jgi:hypothetical protein
MSPVEVAEIAVVGLLCIAAVWFGLDPRPVAQLGDEEPTPAERPSARHRAMPVVTVLFGVAAEVEASGVKVAEGLRDIARVIQLTGAGADERTLGKIAGLVDEHGSAVKREAQRILEVKPT